MDYTKFIGREEELGYLRKELASKGFRFIPIWGRRRVGKTTLILKAMGKEGIYFMANLLYLARVRGKEYHSKTRRQDKMLNIDCNYNKGNYSNICINLANCPMVEVYFIINSLVDLAYYVAYCIILIIQFDKQSKIA